MKQWLLLFLIILWGCSPIKKQQLPKSLQNLKNLTAYLKNTKPARSITFKEIATYGSSEKLLIGNAGDIAVDDSGRVFIAGLQNMVINVFRPNGQFITQIGRKGKGPFEFTYINKLQISNKRLYVFDSPQYKLSIFTLDNLIGNKTVFLGRNRANFQELNKAYPTISKLYIRNNGTYISEFISNSTHNISKWQNIDMIGMLYLLNENGMITSKLFNFITEIRTVLEMFLYPVKPFFGDALIVLSDDNHIYLAGGDKLLIKVYSPDGIYRRAFYYPQEKIPLTRKSAIKAKIRDSYVEDMESMKLPKYWPVLTRMKIDEQDRLWVATTVKDMKVYQWWVLKPNGRLIARFLWPRSKPIQTIKNGYLYTRETEMKTGLEQIVKYRFEMKKNLLEKAKGVEKLVP